MLLLLTAAEETRAAHGHEPGHCENRASAQEVHGVVEAAGGLPARHTPQPFLAMSIVHPSLLLVGEDLVRLRDLDEASRCHIVARVLIAVLVVSL